MSAKTSQKLYYDFDSMDELLNGSDFKVLNESVVVYQKEKSKKPVIAYIRPEAEYSVEDYNMLPEGAPYQLINGKLVYMPSPTFRHQEILLFLAGLLKSFVDQHHLGKVNIAPLDVQLDIKNVYQPDILFISNERMDIIHERVRGAPDVAIEILSSSNADLDRGEKMIGYAKHNVLEYWLIDHVNQTVEVFLNEKGNMRLTQNLKDGGILHSSVIKGFELNVKKMWDQ